ncbi:hypothetical protein QJS10_CPA03g01463 [Acorus calamus]|uniref:RecA family profile 1 domain-containing protein n=1 Tax=Acorus calamus TaxID=4465 RepID=A0AAV9F7R0_ACOCL|nr:hypothetical protein QJS10_CPA03g01463 [Acorus calamus]
MGTLRSMEREFPIIDDNFQRFCASHGIFSVEDFLVHDLSKLASFAEMDAASVSLKQGIAQVMSIIDGLHQPWLNGIELLDDAKLNKHFLATGCEGIDQILRGGLRMGQLTELVGPSSSGKTQVCLCAASHVAEYSVPGRPKKACESDEQHIKQVKDEGSNLRLIVIDSISSLLAPILGGIDANGWSLMQSAGFLLKRLAGEHNLSVLVTNHTVGGEGGIPKPALGESWKSIPHVRLLLSPDYGSDMYNAMGSSAKFVIHR